MPSFSSAGRTSISPRRNEANSISPPASMKVTDGIAIAHHRHGIQRAEAGAGPGVDRVDRERQAGKTERGAEQNAPLQSEEPQEPRKVVRHRQEILDHADGAATSENSTSCSPRIVAPAA